MKNLSLICLASSLFIAIDSRAQNIVLNPGFETGDLTDWTGTDTRISTSSPDIHSGNYAAALDSDGQVSQTLTTVAGHTYDLTFWLEGEGFGTRPPETSFSVFWDGANVLSSSALVGFPYTEESVGNLTATSASTVLTIGGDGGPGFFRLDDVSVVDVTSAGVPDASETAMLLGLATVALGWLRRRNS